MFLGLLQFVAPDGQEFRAVGGAIVGLEIRIGESRPAVRASDAGGVRDSEHSKGRGWYDPPAPDAILGGVGPQPMDPAVGVRAVPRVEWVVCDVHAVRLPPPVLKCQARAVVLFPQARPRR